jgi:IclR-like helix-turn-helix domain-containing protein
MINDEKRSISITLSPTQVDEVVRAASQGRAPSLSTLISNRLAAPLDPENGTPTISAAPQAEAREPVGGGYPPGDTDDPRLSRSLLRGLSILTCFGPDGDERGIVQLAGDLGMSPSTAHRYATTLVELGLLERCPRTRKYRLPGT